MSRVSLTDAPYIIDRHTKIITLAQFSMANLLIIGAGIAGLAAARKLQSGGLQVTILEGRDRRLIFSYQNDDIPHRLHRY